MKVNRKPVLLLITVCFLFFQCDRNDTLQITDPCLGDIPEVNLLLPELKGMAKEEPTLITQDLVVSGIVNSSDQYGNNYGKIYLQDKYSDPTIGICLNADLNDAYRWYQPGDSLIISLKGLYVEKKRGEILIGGIFNAYGNPAVGRLPALAIPQHVYKSCNTGRKVIPVERSVSELRDADLNTLVKIVDVEAIPDEICQTLAVSEETTERQLQDCMGSKLKLVTSGYSELATIPMPTGHGAVIGVLRKISSGFAISISEPADLDMTGLRCGDFSVTCEIPKPNISIGELWNLMTVEGVKLSDGTIFTGVITADDESGNFNRELYVQEGNNGIRIPIDGNRIFGEGYTIGSVLVVDASGLLLREVNGVPEIFRQVPGSVEAIPLEECYRYLYLTGDQYTTDTERLSIAEVEAKHLGSLVTLRDVQFLDSGSLKPADDDVKLLIDCYGSMLVMKISSNFEGAVMEAPHLIGNITGILEYDKGYQIRIRDLRDIGNSTATACDILDLADQMSLQDFMSEYAGESDPIRKNIKIKGVVITDRNSKNFEPRSLILQDGTMGVGFDLGYDHEWDLNSGIEVGLAGARLEIKAGVPMISGVSEELIRAVGTLEAITPISVSPDILPNMSQGTLLEIEHMQPENSNAVFEEQLVVSDCYNELSLTILPEAYFYGNTVLGGSGSITFFKWRDDFMIRNTNDLDLSMERSDCSEYYTSRQVFISEIADPVNTSSTVNGRFVELANSGDQTVNLKDWEIRRYTNDNLNYTPASVIELSGYEIPPGGTLVIAADADGFLQTYGFDATCVGGGGSAADSNGDDTIVLIDGNGGQVDIFGIPGEDGTGTNHDFEDGRVLRKKEVNYNNSVYDYSEWNIWNNSGVSGSMRKPQTAPDDFTPGMRN
ncbi:DUF5689 domain-containing protein [Robertkochia solimangrovi]|uniref:DUF5689 domain-containing protein n=1 Tax=Robertkochia solimangrovi TaxID=2213046 RepID=UPI00118105FF|nr:DUF5689 domain-containing protein [Robertkochia solimangrovi]TRZ45836.1 hypothetical protein DMZ48_00720 [Robertkochia solimangrovi]